MEWTTSAAQHHARAGQLEVWIHAYLATGEWANPRLSAGLRRPQRWWRGWGCIPQESARRAYCHWHFPSLYRPSIGQQLLAALETWARARAVHRVELTVMAHNAHAIRLYKRMEFAIEGTKRHALLVNGTYIDGYYMAKLLE